MNKIFVNTLIEWLEDSKVIRLDRIIWISEDGKNAVKINISDKRSLPEWTVINYIENALTKDIARKARDDPFAFLHILGKDYLSKHSERRDKAWGIIKNIVYIEPDIYDRDLRGKIVVQAALEAKVKKDTVYKYLRRYWMGGMNPNALLPAFYRCGGFGKPKNSQVGVKRGRPQKILLSNENLVGINVDEEIKQVFRAAIEKFYNKPGCLTLKKTYQKMCREFFNNGYYFKDGFRYPILKDSNDIPTFTQFRYWFKKEFDIEKTTKAREGRKGFELRYRALLGDISFTTFSPGHLWEIDATIVDVYLVSIVYSKWIIGRPVFYIVVDSFSRNVEGFYIGLEGPSWLGAMMALENAMTEKVSFCAQYGVHITEEDWPCHHMPRAIIGDRGEMISRASDTLPNSLNIPVRNTPPYRADLKPIVERHFRIAKDTTIIWLPGAIKKRFRERGEPDHRLDAILTINDFTEIMIRTILRHNNEWRLNYYPLDRNMVSDNVRPIPRELRNWGIANRSGILREQPPDIIRLGLMPKEMATITEGGIYFNGAHYSSERSVREKWFEKARSYGSKKIEIGYDPRRTEYIYIPYRNGEDMTFDKCRILPKDERYLGLRFEEIQDWRALEEIDKHLGEHDELQSRCDLDTETEAIVSRAKKRHSSIATSTSKSKQVEGIKTNKAEEKARLREQQAWELGKESEHHGELANVYQLRTEDAAHNVSEAPRKAIIESLRRARDSQWEG